jgi:RNA polymerase sigma factor (sigma-70 family)
MPDIEPERRNIDPGRMTWRELLCACAERRSDSELWTEFLRRYGHRIKQFVKGTLRIAIGKRGAGAPSAVLGGMQVSDLVQSTILRLVEQDCAAIRRFSGNSDFEWLAYLAVITRSVVRESIRRHRALKRPGGADAREPHDYRWRGRDREKDRIDATDLERGFLAYEIRALGERSIGGPESECSNRDKLIFRLYFEHDMSINQIAQCEKISLSKAGVEKALNRVKDLIRGAVSREQSEEMTREKP